MFRFFFIATLSFFPNIIFAIDSHDFQIQELSVSQAQVEALGQAVFLIEDVFAQSDMRRDELVQLIQTFGREKKVTTLDVYQALITMIDFYHRGAILSIDGKYGVFQEYTGGVRFDASVSIDTVGNALYCYDYVGVSQDSCDYKDVIRLDVVETHIPDQAIRDSTQSFLERRKINLGCPEDAMIRRNRRWRVGDDADMSYVISSIRIDNNFPVGREQYIGQQLPLLERNYGSHGPSPHSCQSSLHIIERFLDA